MAPEVIAFVLMGLVIVLSFAGLAIKWDNDFKLKRDRQRREEGDNSLGTGELRELIQESMHEAISPLEERLDLVEKRTRQLPEHSAERQEPENGE